MIRPGITGTDQLLGLAEEARAELSPRMADAVGRSLNVLKAKVDQMLSRPGAGRPSSPGAPPAEQTGELRKSMRVKGPRVSKTKVRGTIESKLPQAPALEYGGTVGRNKSVRIPPRPYIRPAMEQAEPEIDRIMEEL